MLTKNTLELLCGVAFWWHHIDLKAAKRFNALDGGHNQLSRVSQERGGEDPNAILNGMIFTITINFQRG